jgi:acetyl-CoA synthetase
MVQSFEFGGKIVWQPTPDYVERAHLTHFMRQHNIENFDTLMQRSTDDVAWFTEAVLKYLQIEFYEPYTQVVDLSSGIQWPHWCLGGKMNIIHNCLDKYIGTSTEHQTALIWEGEDASTRALTCGRIVGNCQNWGHYFTAFFWLWSQRSCYPFGGCRC